MTDDLRAGPGPVQPAAMCQRCDGSGFLCRFCGLAMEPCTCPPEAFEDGFHLTGCPDCPAGLAWAGRGRASDDRQQDEANEDEARKDARDDHLSGHGGDGWASWCGWCRAEEGAP